MVLIMNSFETRKWLKFALLLIGMRKALRRIDDIFIVVQIIPKFREYSSPAGRAFHYTTTDYH